MLTYYDFLAVFMLLLTSKITENNQNKLKNYLSVKKSLKISNNDCTQNVAKELCIMY